jgi:hypothetical protein
MKTASQEVLQTPVQESVYGEPQEKQRSAAEKKYWKMYEEYLFNSYYYWHYCSSSSLRSKMVKSALILVTLGNVVTLPFWNTIPDVWRIIAAVAQFISAISYMLPYNAQITAINMFHPALENLLLVIEHDWDQLDVKTDTEVYDLIFKYKTEYSAIHSKFIGSTEFPRRRKCAKKAEKDYDNYKFHHFDSVIFDSFKDLKKRSLLSKIFKKTKEMKK